jgi:hypothetical protein
MLAPSRFKSRMRYRDSLIYETDAGYTNSYIVYGPYMSLRSGHFRVTFGLCARGLLALLPLAKIKIEVVRDGAVIAMTRLRRKDLAGKRHKSPILEFDNEDEGCDYEFRVHLRGISLGGLQFSGIRLDRIGAPPPRFRPGNLHMGEQLSLLIELVKQRMAFSPLPEPADRTAEASSLLEQLALAYPRSGAQIMIAPISNSSLRDWPIESYARLVSLLLETTDCQIFLLGTHAQAPP